jgi:hypothetical protein
MVTGADIDSGNSLVVLRTYREIYVFRRAPDGTMVSRVPVKVCDIAGLESQGEGIAWLDDTRLILTSEEGNLGPGTVTGTIRNRDHGTRLNGSRPGRSSFGRFGQGPATRRSSYYMDTGNPSSRIAPCSTDLPPSSGSWRWIYRDSD